MDIDKSNSKAAQSYIWFVKYTQVPVWGQVTLQAFHSQDDKNILVADFACMKALRYCLKEFVRLYMRKSLSDTVTNVRDSYRIAYKSEPWISISTI